MYCLRRRAVVRLRSRQRHRPHFRLHGGGGAADEVRALAKKYPDVNLVLSHGGGALPYILGRLKKSHASHPIYADPQASFERLYFDTVLFEIPALKFLCEVAGPKKVVLGTDHPFPARRRRSGSHRRATRSRRRRSKRAVLAAPRRGYSESTAAAARITGFARPARDALAARCRSDTSLALIDASSHSVRCGAVQPCPC